MIVIWFRIILGLFFSLFSLTIVGYQALLPVLLSSNVYYYLCQSGNETIVNQTSYTNQTIPCESQQLALDLMFIVGISSLHLSVFLAGLIQILLKPATAAALGSLMTTLGAILIAFSSQTFPAYTVGYILMALGGPFMAFPMISLTLLLPDYTPILLSLFIAALDASSVVMVIFRLLYQNYQISMEYLFMGMAIITALLFPCSFFIFHNTEQVEIHSELSIKEDDTINPPNAPYQHERISRMIFRPVFGAIVCWATINITTKYFYLITIERQLQWITNYNTTDVNIAIWFFSIFLPCSGLFIPITGQLLKTGLSVNLVIMGFLSLATGIFAVIKNYPLQYVTMVLLIFNRFYFFVTVPVLLSKLFGPLGSTTLFGIVIFIAAVGNYTNYVWDWLSYIFYDKGFIVLNIAQNILCLIFSTGLAWIVSITVESDKSVH